MIRFRSFVVITTVLVVDIIVDNIVIGAAAAIVVVFIVAVVVVIVVIISERFARTEIGGHGHSGRFPFVVRIQVQERVRILIAVDIASHMTFVAHVFRYYGFLRTQTNAECSIPVRIL